MLRYPQNLGCDCNSMNGDLWDSLKDAAGKFAGDSINSELRKIPEYVDYMKIYGGWDKIPTDKQNKLKRQATDSYNSLKDSGKAKPNTIYWVGGIAGAALLLGYFNRKKIKKMLK